MATTTNYSWSTPDNTAYVKDGASAIRTLGSSVDTTLFTALGGAYPGLRLIKKQTIGTGVSSVSVTSAFSATYENYKILVTGGSASSTPDLNFSLDGITTGYYSSLRYSAYNSTTPQAISSANAASFAYTGSGSSGNLYADIEIKNPFAAKTKVVTGVLNNMVAGGAAGEMTGFNASTTSATAFTITPSAGTLTGGTIYVYGYGAS